MSESIGIIAGSGQFPRLVAEDAKAAGYGVVVCAFHGFTDPGLEALADAYTTVYLGPVSYTHLTLPTTSRV